MTYVNILLTREKVGVLLSKLPQATKLQSQYAKAREADGHYQEAAVAYEKANDYDNAIRYCMNYAIIAFNYY